MLWILVYVTTAGLPAITEPMKLESCIALAARPEFAGSFCFHKDVPALVARPRL
jgi:hypothetical protein